MSTNLPAHVRKVAAIAQRSPRNMREHIIQQAIGIASTAIAPEQAAEAATRVALAFDAARAAARNPGDFDACSAESKALCVADCMITGLMPGGPNADAWLIPRGGKLTFMPSHRGLQRLANRAGYHTIPTPVHVEDDLKVYAGEVEHHETDPRRYPASLDQMQGVIVRVKDLQRGHILGDYWVPLDVITTRRDAKDFRGRKMAGNVWSSWPVEMALKTAVKWAFARGLVPARSEAITAALAAEQRNAEAVANADARERSRTRLDAFMAPPEPPAIDVEPEPVADAAPVEAEPAEAR